MCNQAIDIPEFISILIGIIYGSVRVSPQNHLEEIEAFLFKLLFVICGYISGQYGYPGSMLYILFLLLPKTLINIGFVN
jgi:hypothetical protein